MQPFCIPLPKAYKMKFQNCRDNPCPAQSRLEPLNHYLTQILGPLSQFAHHYLKKKKKTNSAESLLKRLLFLGYLLWLLLLVLSLGPQGLQRARLLCPWNFPGKDTRVICHSLLQGIFSTQRSTHVSCTSMWILSHWATREAGGICSPRDILPGICSWVNSTCSESPCKLCTSFVKISAILALGSPLELPP